MSKWLGMSAALLAAPFGCNTSSASSGVAADSSPPSDASCGPYSAAELGAGRYVISLQYDCGSSDSDACGATWSVTAQISAGSATLTGAPRVAVTGDDGGSLLGPASSCQASVDTPAGGCPAAAIVCDLGGGESGVLSLHVDEHANITGSVTYGSGAGDCAESQCVWTAMGTFAP